MKRVFIVFMLCIGMLLTGCGKDAEKEDVPTTVPDEEKVSNQEEETKEDEPEVEDEQESTEEIEDWPEFMNPLTGLEVAEEYVNARPVAVMINNIKQALPQYGISQADIIYEILAEGGITRMVAVYQDPSGVGSIGSVRSTRAYYLDIAQGHDAILLHAGGSTEAYNEISNRGVAAIDALGGSSGGLYWRDQTRISTHGYEHSMFTSGENIVEHLASRDIRTKHEESYEYVMSFTKDGTPENGESASKISVTFSSYKTGVFEYNTEDRLYYVSEYGSAHMDAGAGEQIAFSNVLILNADSGGISGDTAGRIWVDLVGSGTGKFCCGGKMVDITWTKDSYTDQFTYALADGTPLQLEAGRSYVCIINSGNSIVAE